MTDENLPTRASRRASRTRDDQSENPNSGVQPIVDPAETGVLPVVDAPAADRPFAAEPVNVGPVNSAPAFAQPVTAESMPLDAPEPAIAAAHAPKSAGHARKHRSHKAFKGVAVAMVGVMAFTGTAAAAIYRNFDANPKRVAVDDLIAEPNATQAPPNDPAAGTALNYLIIGSDSRAGDNGKIAGLKNLTGMRSDTTIVMHISANRKRVDVVSIPRDSMVKLPACKMTNGKRSSAGFGMFNSAFATGADLGGDLDSAIACTWKTVQENTGLSLDGAIAVDFSGFEKMIDALGGVPICVPVDTVAPEAKLNLKAGMHTLNGKQALGFARARKGTGQNFDGSDTMRTGRQQQLMAAIFNELAQENIFTNLPNLFEFANAATKSLTVTEELGNTKKLVGLAYSLRNVKSKNVTFMTIPYEAYPPNPRARIQWSSKAPPVWEAMKTDKPMTEPEGKPTSKSPSGTTDGTSKGKSTPTPKPTKTPARDAFTADDTTAVC